LGRILRLYAIREIALPTLMALLTITFILMIRYVYEMVNLVLQPGVGLPQVANLLVSLLPSVLVFAAPMAVLVGVLIGVGRMTLDHEVLAIRASGVNLMSVFAPAIALSLVLSLSIFWLSAGLVPAMMRNAMLQIGQLKLALANSLEPGRFYENLFGGNAVLFFKERDPKTQRMLGITLEMEKNVKSARFRAGKAGAATPGAGTPAPPSPAGPQATATTNDPTSPALTHAGGSATPLAARVEKGVAKRTARPDARSDEPDRETELTLIFARFGQIAAQQANDDPTGGQESEVTLTFDDGSIHQLSVNPGERDYVVINFDQLQKRLFPKTDIEKRHHTLDNAELRRRIGEQQALPQRDRDEKSLGTLLKELWQRRTMWLATFVFVLVGIPLAIWVRPSGKSWGILIAIGLMLVYYVILQMGLSLIQQFQPAGIVVAMLPNLLYGLIGALLWRQALRS
jgi:lipopolysaccharide export system permease protein